LDNTFFSKTRKFKKAKKSKFELKLTHLLSGITRIVLIKFVNGIGINNGIRARVLSDDRKVTIAVHAALVVDSRVVVDITAAARSGRGGSIRSSSNSVLVTGRSFTVGTTAVILRQTSDTVGFAVGFSVKSTPSSVIRFVPQHPGVTQTNGQDSVTFAGVSFASVVRSFVNLIFTGQIVSDTILISSLTPSVSSGFRVAVTSKVHIQTFVAEGEFFADFINGIDGLTITGSQVVLTVGQAPAAVVAVSTEDSDLNGLQGHDHSLQVLESVQVGQFWGGRGLIIRVNSAFLFAVTFAQAGTLRRRFLAKNITVVVVGSAQSSGTAVGGRSSVLHHFSLFQDSFQLDQKLTNIILSSFGVNFLNKFFSFGISGSSFATSQLDPTGTNIIFPSVTDRVGRTGFAVSQRTFTGGEFFSFPNIIGDIF